MTGAFAMPAILAGALLISLKAAVVAAVGRVELDVEENPPSQPQTAAMELDVDGVAFSSAKSDEAGYGQDSESMCCHRRAIRISVRALWVRHV